MRRFTKLFATAAVVATASASMAAAADVSQAPGWTRAQMSRALAQFRSVVTAPNVSGHDAGSSDAALRRFLAASIPFMNYGSAPRFYVDYYDPLTRCALVITYDLGGATVAARLVRPIQAPVERTAIKTHLMTTLEMTILEQRSDLPADASCSGAIDSVYGDGFARDARNYSSLSDYTVRLLAEGANAKPSPSLSPSRLKIFTEGQRRMAGLVTAPVFLGAATDKGTVLVMVGDRFSAARWVGEFETVDEKSWKLRGAIDVGVTR